MSLRNSRRMRPARGAGERKLSQVDAHQQQLLRGKAEVGPLQVVDRAHQQAGRNQQRQRQCQLQAHQQTTGSLAGPPPQ